MTATPSEVPQPHHKAQRDTDQFLMTDRSSPPLCCRVPGLSVTGPGLTCHSAFRVRPPGPLGLTHSNTDTHTNTIHVFITLHIDSHGFTHGEVQTETGVADSIPLAVQCKGFLYSGRRVGRDGDAHPTMGPPQGPAERKLDTSHCLAPVSSPPFPLPKLDNMPF